METEKQPSSISIEQMDDISKSFQRESEALRELVRTRDKQIKSLLDHSICLRTNFKSILEAIVDRVIDDDIQFHAKKMLNTIDQAGNAVDKVGL